MNLVSRCFDFFLDNFFRLFDRNFIRFLLRFKWMFGSVIRNIGRIASFRLLMNPMRKIKQMKNLIRQFRLFLDHFLFWFVGVCRCIRSTSDRKSRTSTRCALYWSRGPAFLKCFWFYERHQIYFWSKKNLPSPSSLTLGALFDINPLIVFLFLYEKLILDIDFPLRTATSLWCFHQLALHWFLLDSVFSISMLLMFPCLVHSPKINSKFELGSRLKLLKEENSFCED